MRHSFPRSAVPFSLLAVAALALPAPGCVGAADEDPGEAAPAGPPSGVQDLGEIVAHLDPKSHTLTFSRVTSQGSGQGLSPQSIDEITIDVDGTAGTGAANTVELVTNSTGTNGQCPSGYQTNSFCGNVTMRSFNANRALSNVYLQVTKITDSSGNNITGHSGLNSDPSFSSLSNGFGLWKFTGSGVTSSGVLAQQTATNGGGNAGTRDLVFANPDDADTNIYMHVYATLTYSSYTMSSLTAGIPTTNNACLQGGTKLLGQNGGTGVTTASLPFPFTFYGTTYAATSKLTISRYGAMGLGTQSTASSAPTNTGTNVALPNAGGTAYKPGIFPFWENLNYTTNTGAVSNSPSAICSLTSGNEPNRVLVITWHDMKFTNDSNAVYPGSPTMNISAILHEGSDVIDFVYGIMLNPTASRANGGVATIGVQNETGTVATAKNSITGSVAANSMYTLTPNP